LASVYDHDTDVQVKRIILSYLGVSEDPRATDKLFSIAQSDPSPDLRRGAIAYLAER
jgi:HEAT repeats